MRPNFQKKVNLNRKTSANSSREREQSSQDKPDKLTELRAKIEKEREIMRQSGKRFHKISDSKNSHKQMTTAQSLYTLDKTQGGSKFFKKENKVAEVSVGPLQQEPSKVVEPAKQVPRQTVDLTSLITQPQGSCLNSSRLFEKQVAQQKNRNKQLEHFLQKLGLEQFSQGLINLGYDQLDLLVEVTSEQLNFLMMRAAQQRVLNAALKEYRDSHGLSQVSLQTAGLRKTTADFKAKAKNQLVREKAQEARREWRPKSALTVASTTPTNNSGLFSVSTVNPNPSFFIGIGGQDWSMDSLVRRACSACFKVFPGGELVQEESNYYCKPCKQKEEDPVGMLMNGSMIRDYKL